MYKLNDSCVRAPWCFFLSQYYHFYPIDTCLSNSQDLSSDSGTDFKELSNIKAHQEHKTGTSPHHWQSASFMAFFTRLGAPEVCRHVLNILEYMESLPLNLPILLWALCWNNAYPDLVSNNKARFVRTGLTMSELLPRILRLLASSTSYT